VTTSTVGRARTMTHSITGGMGLHSFMRNSTRKRITPVQDLVTAPYEVPPALQWSEVAVALARGAQT
jgi:hypothetical protein